MLLIIGDSFGHWVEKNCNFDGDIKGVGVRGGCVSNRSFRDWAVGEVASRRPDKVLLIAGGNDLAGVPFNARQMMANFEELVVGLLEAGAGEVTIFPIPPRSSSRPGGASVAKYRLRRRFLNQLLRRRFPRPSRGMPVAIGDFQLVPGFLGRDGVHPSRAGWRAIAEYANTLSRE